MDKIRSGRGTVSKRLKGMGGKGKMETGKVVSLLCVGQLKKVL